MASELWLFCQYVSYRQFRWQLKTFLFCELTDCGATWLFAYLCLKNTLTYLLAYVKTAGNLFMKILVSSVTEQYNLLRHLSARLCVCACLPV